MTQFILTTAWAARTTEPLTWRRVNERLFPSISIVARDKLALRAFSVASEGTFLRAGDMVDATGNRLCNQSITACMHVKYWQQRFD